MKLTDIAHCTIDANCLDVNIYSKEENFDNETLIIGNLNQYEYVCKNMICKKGFPRESHKYNVALYDISTTRNVRLTKSWTQKLDKIDTSKVPDLIKNAEILIFDTYQYYRNNFLRFAINLSVDERDEIHKQLEEYMIPYDKRLNDYVLLRNTGSGFYGEWIDGQYYRMNAFRP